MHGFKRLALIATVCFAAMSAAAQSPSTSSTESSARVVKRADTYISEFSKRFPEQAVFSGIVLDHHNELTDNTQAASREWEKLEDRWAAELETIDSKRLFGTPEWIVLGFFALRS